MRIMLLGYGKMGKTIEQIAIARGHQVPVKISRSNIADLQKVTAADVDVAIEFTQPESAYDNVRYCIEQGIPVVSGTTGWLDKKQELDALCLEKGGAFFYASNFSVGVNLFFHLNKILARLMNNYPEYHVSMEEIHHTQKKDAPSGTAITLAEGVLEGIPKFTSWVNEATQSSDALGIVSKRIEQVPGTHSIAYTSPIDTIEITHTAHSREGFALGSVVAGEWLIGKKGILGMDDMLKITL